MNAPDPHLSSLPAEPTTRAPAISLPAGSKKMMPGGPNRLKRFSSALSASLLAVTSACSRVMRRIFAATRASEKVYFSISLQETHQSA